jgi:signal peptidase II
MRRHQLLIIAAIIALDRLTKWLVVRRLPLAHDVSIIPGLFQLTHWENTGAAFSMFADSTSPWRTAGLIAFSLLAVAVISVLLWKHGPQLDVTAISLSLIAGGALGNLWDRIAKGTVTDFLDFYVGSNHWPPFNIADSAIVVGSILIAWTILFGAKGKPAS